MSAKRVPTRRLPRQPNLEQLRKQAKELMSGWPGFTLSEAQREQGLMFRRNLAPDAGMLFDMDVAQTITMWMKNTFIPLDMLFVDGGRIVDIRERAVPLSTDIISAKAPARYVIELNGGRVERLGIKIGDRVTSPYIK